MGQLVVGLAGAAVGSAFGNPALGFAAGTFLGGLLFPPDPVRIEGPRREDLRVSSSTAGRPIPEGFGVIRMPGNMIWSMPIREVQTTTEVGGKGGLGAPSQEQVSYTYFVDASFAFAHGPAQAILRVFADGKPIYDVRDPNTTGATLTATTKPGLTLRVYLGTEDQLPCPTIQAAEGTANTPAYRGTVYLTLESFDLTDFGNRIPQITAEVAFKATGSNSGRLSADNTITDFNDYSNLFIDWRRMLAYSFDDNDTVKGLRAWNIATLQEARSQPEADMNLDSPIDPGDNVHVGQDSGRIYYENHNGNWVSIDIIDPDSLVSVGTAGFISAGTFNHGVLDTAGLPDPAKPVIAALDWMVEGSCFATGAIPEGRTEVVHLLGFSTVNDGPVLLDVTNPAAPLMIHWDNGPSITQSQVAVAEPARAQQTIFWILHHPLGNATATLRKMTVDFNAYLDVLGPNSVATRGATLETVATFPPSLWNDDAKTGATIMLGPVYDHTDGNLIFAMNTNTGGCTVWKYNKALDQIQWTVDTASTIYNTNPHRLSEYTRVRNGRFGIANGSGTGFYVIIDTISGVIVEEGSNINGVFAAWSGLATIVWDDTLQVFTSLHGDSANALEQFFIGRKTGQGEALSDVVALFSGANVNGAGLAASEFDVTQLVDDTVRGYAVTRQMPIRRATEPLFAAYDFDATEADDKIKFIKRGGASVATITQADIVAAEQPVRETRTQEVELPERLDLGYIDLNTDYQENMAAAKRPRAPVPTMYSLDSQTLDLAIVFTAAEAKEIAERLLYTAWSQRQKLSFVLGDNYIRLVPTDVITLTLDSGSVFNLRMVKVDIGINHTQTCEAVIQDSELQVASNAIADTSIGFSEDSLPTSVNTRLCLIDAPYLRDIDATNRDSIELKYAMAGYQSGWQSGTLWGSADGVSFSPVGRSTAPKTYGIVTNKLPAGMENLTDTATALTVTMVEGELASVTDAQFIANEQVAIIGSPGLQNWEYVAFRDAVQGADGLYTVSHLMRGRRGTDAPEIAGSHAAGELFIVAGRAAINRILLANSSLNVVRYYRGVGSNDFLENADTVALASKARPLMPHRPHQLAAAVDGANNIDFTWARSTRLNFELTNSFGWNDGPLNEDTESYEVDILDQPGGAVVRTIAVTAAAAYTKAQLIADLAVSNATAQIDVGSSSAFTQAAGSFVTDGFVAGMKIETALFANGANNGIFTVRTVAALTLTIEETSLATETGTGDETVTAIRAGDITFEVYQLSAQAGRGFASAETTVAL